MGFLKSALRALPLWGICASVGADQVVGTDPEAGLPFWAWEDGALEIRLVQRLPDQTRAFFIGRGFSSAAADRVARSCVFQAIMRNLAQGGQTPVLGIDLTDWRLDAGAGVRALVSKDVWDAEWVAAGESEAARIAFRWSLFPTTQELRGGDYNWGMISLGVPPGTRLDLMLSWTIDAEPRGAVLRGLTCAPEEILEPKQE
jgi:hypothetical protein